MTDSTRVRLHVLDEVAQVELTRPEARNALDLRMCLELRAAFEEIDADDGIRVVLLRSAGPAFCAGADLKERTGKDASWVRRRRAASFAAYTAVERCRCPVVALLQGPVVGSGGELALTADFALGADDVVFRFPEPHWGTVGATQRLQRAIGPRRAKELLFTNRTLGGTEAVQLALVARLVPATRLLDEGLETAHLIAQAPPLALSLTKRSIDLGGETDLDRGIRIEMAAIEHNLADGGWRDGVTRFTNRRTTSETGT